LSSMPMYRQAPLPVAARKAEVGLNLPSFYELTRSDVRRIGTNVNELLREMSLA
jgi:perosamine synthetase